jgi:hypothetical protein
MNNFWLLFIFIVVVLLAYTWYSGDAEADKPPVQMLAPVIPPPPLAPPGPVYTQVGDDSEEVGDAPPGPGPANF